MTLDLDGVENAAVNSAHGLAGEEFVGNGLAQTQGQDPRAQAAPLFREVNAGGLWSDVASSAI